MSLHLDCFVLNSSLVESIYSAKEVHSYTEKALAEIENSRLDCMSYNSAAFFQDSIAYIFIYMCMCRLDCMSHNSAAFLLYWGGEAAQGKRTASAHAGRDFGVS